MQPVKLKHNPKDTTVAATITLTAEQLSNLHIIPVKILEGKPDHRIVMSEENGTVSVSYVPVSRQGVKS